MLSEKKQELQVAALENGTVIDHIPSERLFTVVSLLGLEHMSNNITIGFNLKSKKLGTKGIIKIADKFFCDEEINRIAVVAPNVKLNIIYEWLFFLSKQHSGTCWSADRTFSLASWLVGIWKSISRI